MSLLLSEGHVHAGSYPVAHVWSEARIVRQRNASRITTHMVLMQLVIGSNFSKDTGKLFREAIERTDESD